MVEYICSFAALTELSSCLSKQIIPHRQVWQPDCQRDVQHQWIRGRMVWKHLHIRCHTLWKVIQSNSICYSEKKVQVVINDCALALAGVIVSWDWVERKLYQVVIVLLVLTLRMLRSPQGWKLTPGVFDHHWFPKKGWLGWIFLVEQNRSNLPSAPLHPVERMVMSRSQILNFPSGNYNEATTNFSRNICPATTTFQSCLTTWGMVTMLSSTASAFSSSKPRWIGKLKAHTSF